MPFVTLYAVAVASDMLDGITPPYDGARELRHLWLSTDCPNELQPWSMFEDEYELARDGVYGKTGEVEREILHEAQRIASGT